MYVSLKMIGDGTPDDPYRADFPSYSVVQADPVAMAMLAQIGPRDQPPSLPIQGSPLFPNMDGRFVLIGLTPAQLSAWYARLDARYPGRDAPFRPDFP